MKTAIVLLALVGSVSAHAALSTGELPAGQTNCSATIDGETALKKAQASTEAKRVFAEASRSSQTSAPTVTTRSNTTR